MWKCAEKNADMTKFQHSTHSEPNSGSTFMGWKLSIVVCRKMRDNLISIAKLWVEEKKTN